MASWVAMCGKMRGIFQRQNQPNRHIHIPNPGLARHEGRANHENQGQQVKENDPVAKASRGG